MQHVAITSIQQERTAGKRACGGVTVDVEGGRRRFAVVEEEEEAYFATAAKDELRAALPGTGTAVAVDFAPSMAQLFIARSSGEVVSVTSSSPSSSSSATTTTTADVVALVDGGLCALAWAPDGRAAAFATRTARVGVLCEETFFSPKFSPDEHPHQAEATTARISWRGDSEFFAISVGAQQSLRVYNSAALPVAECRLPSQKAFAGAALVPGIVAWRPCGDLIAAVSVQQSTHELVFFERNGVLRAHCAMFPATAADAASTAATPLGLAWNPTSDILAAMSIVEGHDGDAQKRLVVQLWTAANYTWQLKNTLYLALAPPESAEIAFDPEDPQLLYVAAGDVLYTITLSSDCMVGKGPLYTAAVVDGASVALTYLARAVLPPPMHEHKIAFPCNVAQVALLDQDASSVLVAVQLANTELRVGLLSAQEEASPAELRVACKLGFRLLQMQLLSATCVAGIACANGGGVSGKEEEEEKDAVVIVSLPQASERGDSPAHPVVHVVKRLHSSHATLSSAPGKLFLLENDGSSGQQSAMLEIGADDAVTKPKATLCPSELLSAFEVLCTEKSAVLVVGKTRGSGISKLFADKLLLSSRCTSFGVHPEFIVFTSVDNKLHFVSRSAPISANALKMLKKDWKDSQRDMERGATIVAVMHTGGVVLQIPRGNLELVYPRALVLASVRHLLHSKSYRTAFLEARRHRIDLNLVCDCDLPAFLSDSELFVRQINNVDHLNTFISALKNEDTSKTLYKTPQDVLSNSSTAATTARAQGEERENKVNRVCGALLEAFQKVDPDRFLLCTITALAVSQPPRFGDALLLVQSLRTSGKSGELARTALEYLCFLCDVDKLYDVALGMYDLDLVRMVAENSQKDPKEWQPFLASLSKQTEHMRCFTIDEHLRRYSSALRHLAQCGIEHRADCVAFTERHGLFKDAMAIFEEDRETLQTVMRKYARRLSEADSRHEQAGLLFEACGDHNTAADEFAECLAWKQALVAKDRDPTSSATEKAIFATDLADRLLANEQFTDAAAVFERHAGSRQRALGALLEGRLWVDAWKFAQGADEVARIESALRERAIQCTSESAEMAAELRRLSPTLAALADSALAAAAAAAPSPMVFAGRPVPDDTASTVSDAQSAASSSGAGRRRARKQQAKPDARTTALRGVLEQLPSEALQEEVGAALRVMFHLGLTKDARSLQQAFSEVVLRAKESIQAARRLVAAAGAMSGMTTTERLRIETWADSDWSLDFLY